MKTRILVAIITLVLAGVLGGIYAFHKMEKKMQQQAIIKVEKQTHSTSMKIDVEK